MAVGRCVMPGLVKGVALGALCSVAHVVAPAPAQQELARAQGFGSAEHHHGPDLFRQPAPYPGQAASIQLRQHPEGRTLHDGIHTGDRGSATRPLPLLHGEDSHAGWAESARQPPRPTSFAGEFHPADGPLHGQEFTGGQNPHAAHQRAVLDPHAAGGHFVGLAGAGHQGQAPAMPEGDGAPTNAGPSQRSLTMHLGCFVAFCAAFSANLGKVCQKRGTKDLPLLQFKGAVLRSYIGSPWWVVGFGLDVGGAIMTLLALALAPVSLVQPILGCGLAFVAIFSHYLTADRLRAFDWGACALCVGATVGIGLSSEEGAGKGEMFLFVAALLVAFFALVVLSAELAARQRVLHLELAASVSAGVCFGLSACSTRCGMSIAEELAVSESAAAGVASLFAAAFGVAGSVALSATGFFCQTRGLKEGRAIVVGAPRAGPPR